MTDDDVGGRGIRFNSWDPLFILPYTITPPPPPIPAAAVDFSHPEAFIIIIIIVIISTLRQHALPFRAIGSRFSVSEAGRSHEIIVFPISSSEPERASLWPEGVRFRSVLRLSDRPPAPPHIPPPSRIHLKERTRRADMEDTACLLSPRQDRNS
ncbi:uncharacterized protein ACO6RY_01062 [Pungitius sinensis]